MVVPLKEKKDNFISIKPPKMLIYKYLICKAPPPKKEIQTDITQKVARMPKKPTTIERLMHFSAWDDRS